MHRVFTAVLFVTVLSVVMAACTPTATPTPAVAPTEAVQQPAPTEAVQQPAPTEAVQAPADPFDINPADFSGDITMAGSSTVFPVSEKFVELFKADGYEGKGNIKLDSIGSGAGFERFCTSGEIDIANASRGIKDSEIEACKAINRTPIEFRVGTDALAIVINPENTFATNVTLEELAKLFSNEAQKWSDVNPAWPAEDIHRYVPGTDSGTYDFFIEVVMQEVYGKDTGEEIFLGAANLQASEDDNVLVQGVAGDPYAIGFFGFAYYKENEDTLGVLSVDGITPDFDTAEAGTYPLARPLFIYSDATIMQEKPQVAAFIGYYLANVSDIIGEVGYFPASQEAIDAAKQAWLDAQP
ncbi:MAG: PstS family phosphate ABC transporter substrate-binding protein [Bellilinea sp.]